MVDNAEQMRQRMQQPKKRMLPTESAHRFKSKADFLKYFRENCK